MKRLLDERNASDRDVQAAARLLAARGPLADDMLRRQRVRARIRRRRPQPASATWLRRAVLLTLLVGGAAAASPGIVRIAREVHARIVAARVAHEQTRAAATHRHRERSANHAAEVAEDVAPSPSPSPSIAPDAIGPPAIAAVAPTTSAPSSAVPAPVAPVAAPASAQVTAPSVHAAAATHAATRGSRPRASDTVDDESQQLLAAAVRALRHEEAPARAELLLTRYLDRYPDSAAAEDALALAIEATVGRDPPRATAFARRYLARYPSGRWSQLARDALRR